MGLKSQAQRAVSAAFRKAGDLKKAIVLRTATTSFDPVSGIMTKSWSEPTGGYYTDEGLDAYEDESGDFYGDGLGKVTYGILTEYSKWEIKSGLVQATDRRLILKQSDFTNDPDINDDSRITIDDILYMIISPLKKDPFDCVYEMQLRIA